MRGVTDEIWHQIPDRSIQSTWGLCSVCGKHSARGSRKCLPCLEQDLRDEVGGDLARAYIAAVKNLRHLEQAMTSTRSRSTPDQAD